MRGAQTSRRELLCWSALALGTRPWRSLGHAAPASPGSPASNGDEAEKRVRWIMAAPREPALQRGARELAAGLDSGLLLGAVLVAAARDLRTDLPAFNHSALSVSAIDQLGTPAPEAERRRNALWCLDYFKEVQEAEAASGDWRQQPVAAAALPSGAAARAALVQALERWDREAADAALAGWVRSAPLDEVYTLVFEYGLRCSGNLGHKGIYAALSRRALPLAGGRFAEDVLRSVVSSFFLGGRTERAAPFERSRELVGEQGIVPRARRPESDAGPARELLAALRTSAPGELPDDAARLLADGAAQAVLWDAVVAAAAEVAVADPSTAALHALTSTNSLRHIGLCAPSPRVAQLALLQAAAWAAGFRTNLDAGEASVRLDAVEPGPAQADLVFAAQPGFARAAGALALGAQDHVAFIARAARVARRSSDDVHEFKLSAAALEEARRASPWARPFACAALAMHLPAEGRPDGARLQRIDTALAVAAAR
jgi:hypothetical protein